MEAGSSPTGPNRPRPIRRNNGFPRAKRIFHFPVVRLTPSLHYPVYSDPLHVIQTNLNIIPFKFRYETEHETL